jgi:hypothetical protein
MYSSARSITHSYSFPVLPGIVAFFAFFSNYTLTINQRTAFDFVDSAFVKVFGVTAGYVVERIAGFFARIIGVTEVITS